MASIFEEVQDAAGLMALPLNAPPAVLPGLYLGEVGAFVSPGGMGKSYWILQWAMAATTDRLAEFLPGFVPDVAEISVAYLTLEDPLWVLRERVASLVAAGWDCPLPSRLKLLPMKDEGQLDLLNTAHLCDVLKAIQGTQVVIIDTLSLAHLADENDAGQMKKLLGQLKRIAKGDPNEKRAVIYLHHPSKQAVLAGQGGLQQAARGSSVLVDHARWAAALTPGDDGKLLWGVTKQNYGQAYPGQWYSRSENGAFCPELSGISKMGYGKKQGGPVSKPAPVGAKLGTRNSADFAKNW